MLWKHGSNAIYRRPKMSTHLAAVVVQWVGLGGNVTWTGHKFVSPKPASPQPPTSHPSWAQQMLLSNVVIAGGTVVVAVVVLVAVALQFPEPGALLAELIFPMASTAHAGQSLLLLNSSQSLFLR